jgi:predicted nucleotidyltransferase
MDALTKSQLSEIVRTLRANGVVYARLFGSAAAGTLTFDSDIDLAVSGARPLTTDETQRLIDQVSAIALRPVDILDLRTARGAVFDEAIAGDEFFCDSEEAKADAQYRRVTVIQDDIEYARSSFNAAKDRMFVS